MLTNDDRQAAKDLNAAEAKPQRATPTLPREVAHYHNAYLFGHYDSRGGSTLIIGGNPVQAILKYVDAMFAGMPEATYAAFDDLTKSGSEGPVELIVCDQPLPTEDGELLHEYRSLDAEGYTAAWLDWQHKYGSSQWTDGDHRAIVLWKADQPSPVRPPYVITPELQGVRSEHERFHLDVDVEFGEDAFGMLLLWNTLPTIADVITGEGVTVTTIDGEVTMEDEDLTRDCMATIMMMGTMRVAVIDDEDTTFVVDVEIPNPPPTPYRAKVRIGTSDSTPGGYYCEVLEAIS